MKGSAGGRDQALGWGSVGRAGGMGRDVQGGGRTRLEDWSSASEEHEPEEHNAMVIGGGAEAGVTQGCTNESKPGGAAPRVKLAGGGRAMPQCDRKPNAADHPAWKNQSQCPAA